MKIATGIRVVDRQPATVFRTITSVKASGLGETLYFFVDGEFSAIDNLSQHGIVTQRLERSGAWPNFFLSLNELYLRDPDADLYALFEDDVVLCRDLRPYLEAHYRRLGIASLFTSEKVERWIADRGPGFHRQNPGWNVASGGQAWLFNSEYLREFLKSDFVVNYRRSPPQDVNTAHYRRDGLHHTDSVVGQFARDFGCGIQYHFPSLVQHIGDQSFMYPTLADKRDIRFSHAFPGEDFSAVTLTSYSGDRAQTSESDCAVLVPINGRIDHACEAGLRELEDRGYVVRRLWDYSNIDQARNEMATGALLSNFPETMWIDPDIAFRAKDVDQLRSHNLPITAAIYPVPGQRRLASRFLPGTQEVVFGDGGGLLEVEYAGIGFLHVRREVYDTIRQKLHLRLCNLDSPSPAFPFFLPMVLEDPIAGHACLSEGFSFCHRARQAGFQIFADTTIRVHRVGTYGFEWEDAGSERKRFSSYKFGLP